MKRSFVSVVCVAVLLQLVLSSAATTACAQVGAAAAVTVAESDLGLPAEVQPYVAAAKEKWEGSIAKWEAVDRSTEDPQDAILLIGSSSIRRWDTAAEDLAPYPVIGRGYGGARFTDLVVFAERLIRPHEFKAVVIFVANDITGGDNDRPQDIVEACVKHVVKVAQDHAPAAPVVLIEITPTSSRRKGWGKVRKLNSWLREYSLTTPNVSFVSTAEWYLDSNDEVRDELFVKDKLHLNERGYEIWGKLIKRELDRVLSAN